MARSATTTDAFNAIAEQRRREIIGLLAQHERTVSDLVDTIGDVTQPQVSKHLRVLERAQLVRRRIKGRDHYLSVNIEPLQEAAEWIETYQKFWEKRVDALETFLVKKRAQKERKF